MLNCLIALFIFSGEINRDCGATVLLTNWVTLGKSGPTVDKRLITEQDLIDVAETYNPETYTAVINSDHQLNWFGNFGSVREVRLSEARDGSTCLQGRLAPNSRLVEMNKNGQRLFPSMELLRDFAGTGRTYLVGLAVTDSPASLGTSMLKFRTPWQNSAIYQAEPAIEPIRFTDSPCSDSPVQTDADVDSSSRETHGLIRKFLRVLRNADDHTVTSDNKNQPPGAENMDDAEFSELKQILIRQGEQIDKLSAMCHSSGGGDTDDQDPDDQDTGDQDTGDQTTDLKTDVACLADQLQKLRADVVSVRADIVRLSQENTGTPVPEGTGSAGTPKPFI